MLIWGGVSHSTSQGSTVLDDGVAYDAASGKWSVLPSNPTAAGWLASIRVFERSMYVLGGLTVDGARRDFSRLDLDSGRWDLLPPAPLAAVGGSGGLFSVEQLLVSFDAVDQSSGESFTRADRPMVFDRLTETWSVGAAPPKPIQWTPVATIAQFPRQQHRFVVLSNGNPGGEPASLWAYDALADQWEVLELPSELRAAAGSAAYRPVFSADGRLLLLTAAASTPNWSWSGESGVGWEQLPPFSEAGGNNADLGVFDGLPGSPCVLGALITAGRSLTFEPAFPEADASTELRGQDRRVACVDVDSSASIRLRTVELGQ